MEPELSVGSLNQLPQGGGKMLSSSGDNGPQISGYASQDENATDNHEEQKARWMDPKESDRFDG